MTCPTLQNKSFGDELLSGGESLSSEPFLQVCKQEIVAGAKSGEYADWGSNS